MRDWRQPIRPPIKHTFDAADDIRLHGMSAALPNTQFIETSREEVVVREDISNEPAYTAHAFD